MCISTISLILVFINKRKKKKKKKEEEEGVERQFVSGWREIGRWKKEVEVGNGRLI